ncbi:MAG: hypothetical protein GY828_06635 [Candidatus Gracilibacteria bacterium]|nr:hypothetical protein [Candidatus Gracilibacteria bacterium]
MKTNFTDKEPSFKDKAETVVFVLKKIISQNNGNIIINYIDKPVMVYKNGCNYPILINPISLEDFLKIQTLLN